MIGDEYDGGTDGNNGVERRDAIARRPGRDEGRDDRKRDETEDETQERDGGTRRGRDDGEER